MRPHHWTATGRLTPLIGSHSHLIYRASFDSVRSTALLVAFSENRHWQWPCKAGEVQVRIGSRVKVMVTVRVQVVVRYEELDDNAAPLPAQVQACSIVAVRAMEFRTHLFTPVVPC